jgi:FOG: Ankyrin repeat
VDVLRVLGELGADMNKATKDGATPAHIASQQGHVEVLRVLNELGADMNKAMNDGATPAHIASRNGHAEVLRVLGELGADLNALSSLELSPLAIACVMGNGGVVRILCLYGAARDCPRGSAEELAQGGEFLGFLQRTRGFVNPLQYSEDLTVDEARCWLRSERLRGFPQVAFVGHGSPACDLIEPALVWGEDVAALFPASCRRRARDLVFILWEQTGFPRALISTLLLRL